MNIINAKTSLVSLACAAALACGSDDSMQVGSRYLTSATVDASGGGFVVDGGSELEGLRLEVPADAVEAEVRVGVTPTGGLPTENDIDWVGPAADFGPDGQQFSVPVRITLPLTQSIDDREPVVRVVSADGTRELIAGAAVTVSDGFMSFEIDHFTRFQPGLRRSGSNTCRSDADCGSGDVCGRQGVCVSAPEPECRSDANCDDEEICSESGRCIPEPGCTSDRDCSQGEECGPDRTCVPASTACEADADCAMDEVCVRDGRTTGMCVVGECTVDADCARGEACSEAYTCVSAPECRTDRDCIAQRLGRTCNRGTCM